eukprot:TRINITY_DN13117_c0_g1_i1.p1 TRINITY_DN13117_c0_g1~~TRINITY_DN13117_c0_g1_i1.p1  ORF type:complete len:226 (-),score=26.41 TRINITY_DN13117_c0_g1_i1:226-903(-)
MSNSGATLGSSTPPLSITPLKPPVCSKCNHIMYATAKFCGQCGRKLETPQATPTTSGTSTPVRSMSSHAVQAISSPGNQRCRTSLVKKKVPPKSVLLRYNPLDHTRNIPILREVYDPSTKTGKTVKELIQDSFSLSQKAKFPKRGQGKPLRATKVDQYPSARGTGSESGGGTGTGTGTRTRTVTVTETGTGAGNAGDTASGSSVRVLPELPKYRPLYDNYFPKHT